MAKELSETETKAILEKIRSEYREHGKLNPKSFDLAGFEKRYLQVLQLRTSVTKFLNEEVAFLEQLKSKLKSIAQKKELQKAETLNRIMDENMERLSSYPKIDFHALAKPEMRYFYGALVDFCERELPALLYMFKGTPDYTGIQEPILNIERIGMSRRGLPSLKIQDFIKQLMDTNGNVVHMEKLSQQLLKDTCLSLKQLGDQLDKIIKGNRISTDRAIRLDQKLEARAYQEYEGKPIGEALDQIVYRTKKIIRDFRMSSIVGLPEEEF